MSYMGWPPKYVYNLDGILGNFTVRLGGRVYANKVQLDKWLLNNSGNKVQKRQYFPRKQKKEQEQEQSGGMRMIM